MSSYKISRPNPIRLMSLEEEKADIGRNMPREDTDIHKGEHYMKTETEAGAMYLQVKEHQRLAATTEARREKHRGEKHGVDFLPEF